MNKEYMYIVSNLSIAKDLVNNILWNEDGAIEELMYDLTAKIDETIDEVMGLARVE